MLNPRCVLVLDFIGCKAVSWVEFPTLAKKTAKLGICFYKTKEKGAVGDGRFDHTAAHSLDESGLRGAEVLGCEW